MSSTAASATPGELPAVRPRRRRWWLLAAAVLAVAAAVVVVVVLTRGPAPGSDSHAIGTPYTDILVAASQPSKPVTFGDVVIYNKSDTPLTLLSARPVSTTPGLEVLGIQTAGPDRPVTVGSAREYPPSGYKGTNRPVAGTVVAPVDRDPGQHRKGTEIIIGVQVARLGQFNFDRLRVRYRQHGTVYSTTLGYRFSICGQTRPQISKCPVPAAWTAGGQSG